MSRRRPARLTSLGATVVVLLLAGLFYLYSGGRLVEAPQVVETPAGEDWYAVYFTDPFGPQAETLRGGPDAALAAAIDQARFSVDVAAYQLNLWSVRDALLRAHERGVSLRVVAESDYILEPEVEDLEAAGIPVLGDRREGLMHHKFVVIDRWEVWTGSMNFTVNGAYRNNNNLVRVRSSRVAEDYTREFEEMFVDDRFGPESLADTPYPAVSLDGTRVEVLFSPEDGVAARLVDLVRGAQESVRFMAFSFTSDELAEALIDRARAGVLVEGVMETSQASGRGSEYERLRRAGIDVRLDGNPGNMHHKVLVIDDRVVVTGSYNFSRSAEERNDENVLIVHDPDWATLFLIEFVRVYEAAAP